MISLRERFGQAYLPAVFSRAWLAWCLAEVGAFAEGIAMAKRGSGLPRQSITHSA